MIHHSGNITSCLAVLILVPEGACQKGLCHWIQLGHHLHLHPLLVSSSYCISSILFVYLHKLWFLFNEFLAGDLCQFFELSRYSCFIWIREPGPGPGGFELSPSRWLWCPGPGPGPGGCELSPSRWPSCTRSLAPGISVPGPGPGPGPGGWELSPSRWPSCTRSRALQWWAAPSTGSRRYGRA